MAITIRLSSATKRDIEDIWHYISKDNLSAADKVVSQIRLTIDRLVDNPYMGHKNENLVSGDIRFFPVYSYQIIYQINGDVLHILRILSGYRDIASILEEDI